MALAVDVERLRIMVAVNISSEHLPFVDERESYLFDQLAFFDTVEGLRTPRIGLNL